jgi:hypothetical protein
LAGPALQKNVDEAVEGLRAKGITVVGAVCHVSDAQQRKNLIETAVKVENLKLWKGVSLVFFECLFGCPRIFVSIYIS